MATTDRRELTAKEKRRAKVFKDAWTKKKAAEKLNQGDAGEALDMSPSGFGQYINGKIPIALEAGLALCQYLDVSPEEAELEMPVKVTASIPSPLGAPSMVIETRPATATLDEADPRFRALGRKWQDLSPDQQALVEQTIDALRQQNQKAD